MLESIVYSHSNNSQKCENSQWGLEEDWWQYRKFRPEFLKIYFAKKTY